jgi:predicted LPLAT superfamily acyltransferase
MITEATRAKMRAAKLGRPQSPEHTAARAAGMLAKGHVSPSPTVRRRAELMAQLTPRQQEEFVALMNSRDADTRVSMQEAFESAKLVGLRYDRMLRRID